MMSSLSKKTRLGGHVPGAFASGDGCDCCEPLDPTLDPCCARELSDRRKHQQVLAKLRSLDPVRRAEEIRRNVVDLPPMPPPAVAPRGGAFDDLFKRSNAAAQKAAAAASAASEDDEEEEDEAEEAENEAVSSSSEWDDDDDEGESELMERLRSARVRELEESRLPGLRELSSAATLEAAAASSFALIVLACDRENDAAAHVERAVAGIAADRAVPAVRCRGDALAALAAQARVPADRLEAGALAVYRHGDIAACAPGLQQFANSDRAEAEAIKKWLDNARAFTVPDKNGSSLLRIVSADEEDNEVAQYFDCGKPGCHRPFEHHHIGLGNAPRAWDVNRSAPL